jgi:putative PEP-CTERM system TPR-repeat lipoprotein
MKATANFKTDPSSATPSARRRNALSSSIAAALLLAATAIPAVAEEAGTGAIPEIVKAQEYRAKGNLNGAVVVLKQAIQERPNDPDLRYALGLLYLDARDGASAISALDRALALGTDGFEIRLAQARARLVLGQFDDVLANLDPEQAADAAAKAAAETLRAEAHLGRGEPETARAALGAALTAQPGYAPALAKLALLSLSEQDLDAAEGFLRDADAGGVAADESELLWVQGLVHLERADTAAAVAALQASVDLEPWQTRRRLYLAGAQLAQGSSEDGEENLRQVLQVLPDDAQALQIQSIVAYRDGDLAAAQTLARKVAAATGSAPALLVAGAASHRLGADEEAVSHLTKYVNAMPEDLAGRAYLARSLLRMGDAAAAYAALTPVTEQAAADPALLALLGQAAVRSDRIGEGVGYLQQAVGLSPDSAALRAQLAAAELFTADRAQAITELERLAQEAPQLGEVPWLLAQAHIAAGDAGKAVARVEQAQAGGAPRTPDAALIAGLGYLGNGELDAAEQALQEVLDARPDDPNALTGLAEVRLRKQDVDGARRIIESLRERYPNDAVRLANLAALEAASGNPYKAVHLLEDELRSNPQSGPVKAALARIHFQLGQPMKALGYLDPLEAMEAPDAIALRGQAELMADRPAAAIETFRRLVELRPDAPDAQAALAKAYERNNDYANAASAIEAALALAPERLDLRATRNRLALVRPGATAETAQAEIKDILSLIESDPLDPRVVELRALLASRLGKQQEAIEMLAAAHAAAGSTDSAATLARLQWAAGERPAALETLSEWSGKYPNDNFARFQLGTLQLLGGDLDSAATTLSAALQNGAQRSPVLEAGTAWSLVQTGRVAEAKRYARDAYAVSPDNPKIQYVMGRVRQDEGDLPGAIDLLRKAAEALPQDAAVQMGYARALTAGGRHDEARAVLDQLLGSSDAFEGRTEAAGMRAGLPR